MTIPGRIRRLFRRRQLSEKLWTTIRWHYGKKGNIADLVSQVGAVMAQSIAGIPDNGLRKKMNNQLARDLKRLVPELRARGQYWPHVKHSRVPRELVFTCLAFLVMGFLLGAAFWREFGAL